MGRWLAATAILTLVSCGTQVRADEFPWCVEMDVFTKNCAFTGYDECTTIAKNSNGRCIRNPKYEPPAAAAMHSKLAPAKTSAKQPR